MKPDRTASKRQANRRQRIIAEGGRALHLLIPAEINSKLSAEIERTGESASAAVMRILRESLSVTK